MAEAPVRVLLVGHTGSGKGTLARSLGMAFPIPVFSMGDLVRTAFDEPTPFPFGDALRKHREGTSWSPLPDDLACELAERYVKPHSSWILDGFPRNVIQARFAPWLRPTHVLELVVTKGTARSRVEARARWDSSFFDDRWACDEWRISKLRELGFGCPWHRINVDTITTEMVFNEAMEKMTGGSEGHRPWV